MASASSPLPPASRSVAVELLLLVTLPARVFLRVASASVGAAWDCFWFCLGIFGLAKRSEVLRLRRELKEMQDARVELESQLIDARAASELIESERDATGDELKKMRRKYKRAVKTLKGQVPANGEDDSERHGDARRTEPLSHDHVDAGPPPAHSNRAPARPTAARKAVAGGHAIVHLVVLATALALASTTALPASGIHRKLVAIIAGPLVFLYVWAITGRKGDGSGSAALALVAMGCCLLMGCALSMHLSALGL
ncbi:unnamed protein product [Pedinophyceae sp. YPF-701]|nr:unnamed protein product [Pedinophyceae sp. YPF-701]